MIQGDRSEITMPVTGGADGAIAANLIMSHDAANPGNAKPSTAAQTKFIGVSLQATDTKGYAPIRTQGIVQIRVGAGGAVAAGDYIAADADGKAVTIVPAVPGTVKMVVGLCLTGGAAGALCDVLLQPHLGFTA